MIRSHESPKRRRSRGRSPESPKTRRNRSRSRSRNTSRKRRHSSSKRTRSRSRSLITLADVAKGNRSLEQVLRDTKQEWKDASFQERLALQKNLSREAPRGSVGRVMMKKLGSACSTCHDRREGATAAALDYLDSPARERLLRAKSFETFRDELYRKRKKRKCAQRNCIHPEQLVAYMCVYRLRQLTNEVNNSETATDCVHDVVCQLENVYMSHMFLSKLYCSILYLLISFTWVSFT